MYRMLIGSGMGVAVGISVPVGVRLGTGVLVEVPVGAGMVGVEVGKGDKTGAGRQPVRRASDSTTKVRRFIGNFLPDAARGYYLTSYYPTCTHSGALRKTFQVLSGNTLANVRGWAIVPVGLDDVQK
jgi:hypothetical protein